VALLEVQNIHRWFGTLHAVQDVSFSLDAGQILGFIGPNGAGKTTTIRILAGLLRPASGTVTVGGHSVIHEPRETRALTGYMPDFSGAYENTTVAEYLDFFADAFEIRRAGRDALIRDVLELTGLTPLRDKEVEFLSRGESQRVSLARCLMHDPRLLLLDEPASGLDPRARIELRELIRELSRMGKGVLISSHILTELQDLCTHVAILDKGRLQAWGPREDVLSRIPSEGRFRLAVAERVDEALGFVLQVAGVQTAEKADTRMIEGRFTGTPEEAAEIVSTLVRAGFRVMSFSQDRANLEEAFMRITEAP
jgi:ABC-2 type transport system ATP-binding protein